MGVVNQPTPYERKQRHIKHKKDKKREPGKKIIQL